MRAWVSAATLLSVLYPASAMANECWVAGNFTGKSAMSSGSFAFTDDGFGNGMLLCFTEKGGTVTGNDLPLVRFGESTLIGWAENGSGLETVNTYQIDRKRRKLLIAQSRIGTATHNAILPDYVAAYVADAVPYP